jgi:glycosyltransferase involved in cell wall biosynthesis
LLLSAFEEVRRRVPEAELHIVGAVPPGAAMPGVHAHGFISRATTDGARTLDAIFRRASVFCMPSHYEPFGIAFVEAMLAGLPCVGTTAWAMPEIIADGETGWLVPPDDSVALARALIDALGDPGRAVAFGARGRQRALEHFTWERTATRALEDLARVRGRTGPVGPAPVIAQRA